MTEIFEHIQRGKRLKTADHIQGSMPYVSSTAMNNGIDGFVGNKHGVRIFDDCLTIANSGSVGACFYHAYKFVASDHVTHLRKDGLTPFQYLFLSVMCSKVSGKYNFNREINDDRISREKLFLPVLSDNSPDYAFMDSYGREMTYNMIERYISYKFNEKVNAWQDG